MKRVNDGPWTQDEKWSLALKVEARAEALQHRAENLVREAERTQELADELKALSVTLLSAVQDREF